MTRFPFWGIFECDYSERDSEANQCVFAGAHLHDRSSGFPPGELPPSNLQYDETV